MDRLHNFWRRLMGRRAAAPMPASLSEAAARLPSLTNPKAPDQQRLAAVIAARVHAVRPEAWCGAFWALRVDLKADRVPTLCSFDAGRAVDFLGLASLSRSGFCREAAVDHLARLRDPRSLPFLLLRCVDWVPEVRVPAEQAVRALLEVGVGDMLVAHHRLLARLEAVLRVDASGLLADVYAALRAPMHRSSIERGLLGRDPAVRRFCWRQFAVDLEPGSPWRERLLGDPDPHAQVWLAQRVAAGSFAVSPAEHRRLLLGRGRAAVTILVRALAPAEVAAHRETLVELTMANSPTVRAAARFALRTEPGVDVARANRERFSATPPADLRPGIVSALGDTGGAADAEDLLPLLDHPRARVRCAALLGLYRLDAVRGVEAACILLSDRSARVRRASVSVGVRSWDAMWWDAARSCLETDAEPVRLSALFALAQRGGWEAVVDMLNGLANSAPAVRHAAWGYLVAWRRRNAVRGWLRPTPSGRAELATAWARLASVRDDPLWVPEFAQPAWCGVRGGIERVLGG